MIILRSLVISTGLAASILGATGASPAAAQAPIVIPTIEINRGHVRGPQITGTASVGVTISGPAIQRAGYAHRPYWRPRPHHGYRPPRYRRPIVRRPIVRRPPVAVIERPCSTRIVRKTRTGRVVRVINRCGRYYRPRQRW